MPEQARADTSAERRRPTSAAEDRQVRRATMLGGIDGLLADIDLVLGIGVAEVPEGVNAQQNTDTDVEQQSQDS